LSLAILYINNGYFIESYNALEKSYPSYTNAEDIQGEAYVLSTYGDLYYRLNNFEMSIEYFKKSADLFRNLKDTVAEAKMYINIGACYSEMHQIENATKYFRASIKIFQHRHDTTRLIPCYINFGEILYNENQIDSAIWYFNKSLDYSNLTGTVSDSIHSRFFLGKLYMNTDRLGLAKPLLTSVEVLISIHSEILPINELGEITTTLSKFYEKSGDNMKALLYSNKTHDLEVENKVIQTTKEINLLKVTQLVKENKYEKTRSLWTRYIFIVVLLGLILLFLAFYRSYKHKKEANRLLTEMDELKNRLYSNITHELRTPLTLILGPLEQMLSSETEKTPSRKQVKMMRKNANSLLNLVNQMLDLTKIDAKNMKLELVEEDINKFLKTRFAAFASLAEQKSITYQFSLLNEKNIRIFDSSKLEKIINNLVSNAVKFTEKNGKISCFVNFNRPNMLELIVQDDGKGIPKDELQRIFDRFHQVKTTDELITPGTGIGLSLTKELVELLHGKITVESEEGRGSKFVVTLPLGTAHLNIDEYQMIQNLNPKNHEKLEFSESLERSEGGEIVRESNNGKDSLPHVLIVEDHTDIREFIAENLKDGFFVEQAANGLAGLELAIKFIPDLVITDIVMPKMDGIELCEKLKTDEKTSHIPVVLLTGKSGIDDRLKGLETGADAYLTKPFNIRELRLQVTKLIEQRQKLRERFTRDLRLEPKDIAVTSADEKFINRAMEIIEKNMGNSEFEVRQFQDEMFMSRMQLFRKIKALTNQTPGDFIRTIRLKRAASLIKQNFGNIAQITYEVGFNNPSYFAKCFKDLYGELPSDYMKRP
jgi:signal transduction histidine kinase/DNA-binding response OmpR family regulator